MTCRTPWLPLVSAGLLALSAAAVQAQTAAPAEAVIHLENNAAGQCDAVEKTDLVQVSKSRQPVVLFVITNECPGTAVVSIGGFRHAEQSQAPDPIQESAGNRRVTVPSGQTSRTLRLRVRSNAVEGEWNYDIRVNDRLVDPRLEIDP
jgi:hypothetical protein